MGTSTSTLSAVSCDVNVRARSITVVANEFIRIGLEITHARGVPDGSFMNNLKVVESGLRTWLATHALDAITIELLDAKDKCVEKYVFPISYEENVSYEEHYVTAIDELRSALAKLPPVKATRYRLIANTLDDHLTVPGWKPCKMSDDSHLKKRSLISRLIGTAAVNVSSFVFTGELDNDNSV